MGIKVAKFGGSSVADGIQLTKTKQIITQDPDPSARRSRGGGRPF